MTLEQLAKLANVSTATVSRALSGKSSPRSAARQRVIRIAQELGYAPHGPASALAGGRTGIIGVVPGRGNPLRLGPWDNPVINGIIEAIAVDRGEVLLLGEPPGGMIPNAIARRSVDGVVLMTFPHERIRDWLKSRSFPCVFVDAGEIDEADSVGADDSEGIEVAVRYLASLGHRRIGYVNSRYAKGKHHGPSVIARHAAYIKAMAELGRRAPRGSELNMPLEERIEGLLSLSKDLPTALLCYDDAQAMRVIRILNEKGLRVPQDMSVVGIDDLPDDLGASCELTTVHVPSQEMGKRAIELLLARIADPDRPVEHVILPERLVVRKTTCPPSEGT